MSDDDPLAEIRASFFVECEELLEGLQDGLSAMEAGADDSETINAVFRAAHSIKGGAGAFGLGELVDFAHAYEAVLDCVRSGELHPDRDVLSVFFSAADVLSDLVRAARDGTDLAAQTRDSVLHELEALCGMGEIPARDGASAAAREPAAPRRYSVRFRPHAELYASGNEPLFLIRSLLSLGEGTVTLDTSAVRHLESWDEEATGLIWTVTLETEVAPDEVEEVFDFVLDLCDLSVSEIEADAAAISAPGEHPIDPQTAPENPVEGAPKAVPASQSATAAPTVRVDLEKIDRLMNLVGELVINQAMLSQSVSRAGISQNSDVMQGLDEFVQLTRDIQDSVMTIRAQPVKSLFQRMGRIVREASAIVGKDVRLHTIGAETEVDKTVIERLADPLTHMIRNAVDHGIETPGTRRANGKPDEGVVTLSAAHRSGRVIIEVSDDGGGIDRPRALARARERGLVGEDQPLSDGEIDNLLFMPGFSTAATISSISGRGVGMDVVQNAIQSLGGRVSISSTPGSGTVFTISLPLTLAVLDAMVIEVAGETLVMPLGAVIETQILHPGNLKDLGHGHLVVESRDGYAPLIDLGVELGFASPRSDYVETIALVTGFDNGQRSALVVDAILDQRQVVIKGLSPGLSDAPGISAATILGDGRIALILDPMEITRASATPKFPNEGEFRQAS